MTGDTNSTAAAIEFAVESLRVSDIVICGHSQCGAMGALLADTPLDPSMPHLRDWLKLASPVLETMKTNYAHLTEKSARESAAAEENVLFALENLQSYPAVQRGLEAGTLRLHGWFFKIATAQLFAYDPSVQQFQPLVGPGGQSFGFERPDAGGVAGALFTLLMGFDKPYNQAPSLHIGLLVVLWAVYAKHLRGTAARAVLHLWFAAIGVSVLTTYQHHAIDVPTGAAVGCFALFLFPLRDAAGRLPGAEGSPSGAARVARSSTDRLPQGRAAARAARRLPSRRRRHRCPDTASGR